MSTAAYALSLACFLGAGFALGYAFARGQR